MVPLYRIHRLNEDPAEPVLDYEGFLEGLAGLKHAWRAQVAQEGRPHLGRAAAQPAAGRVAPAGPGAKARKLTPAKTGRDVPAKRKATPRPARPKGAPTG